jgi:acyl-CoA thioesterase-1
MTRRLAGPAFLVPAAALSLLLACGERKEAGSSRPAAAEAAQPGASSPSPETAHPSREALGPAVAGRSPSRSPAGESRPLVVFLGDSLTAAFGLEEDEGYPARVAAELDRRGLPIRALNAGVSGDTTAGGLERLDWLLAQRPDVVVVELGANDGLRGQPLAAVESNLRAIVERSRAAGARVVLAGMRIPTNYGPEYTRDFHALYPRLAQELGVPLIPFLLEGVAARPELNLPDGIHPNARGYEIVARTVAEALAPVLEEIRKRAA